MNSVRKKLIRQTLLETLKHAQGYAVPEESLRPHVDALIRPPLSDAEWNSAITEMADPSRGLIAAVPSDLDPDLKQWAITERGRTVLATL
jgi:hypothetical protein